MIVVQTVIKELPQTAGLTQARVEDRDDLKVNGEIRSRQLVGQSVGVPMAGQRGAGKVTPITVGGALPQCRRGSVAKQRIEVRPDKDVYTAVELRSPDIGCVLNRNETLLPDCGPGVTAYGNSWSRIVESFPRSIIVDDDDVDGSLHGVRHGHQKREQPELEPFSVHRTTPFETPQRPSPQRSSSP